MADIIGGPPLPPEIQSQMQPPPAATPQPGAGLASFFQNKVSQDGVMASLDAGRKIRQVMPLLEKLADMAPELSPDIDKLGQSLVVKLGPSGPPTAPPSVGPPQMQAPLLPGQPAPQPPEGPAPEMQGVPQGVMGVAVQLEMLLPQIASADPSLGSVITGFLSKLRQEVPKILEGERNNGMNPPPTDEMLARLPAA